MSDFEKEFEQVFESESPDTADLINPDSMAVKISELAYTTATYLVDGAIQSGSQFVNTDILPLIRLVMFRQFINQDHNSEFDKHTVIDVFDEIIETGEYNTLKNHPLYEIYCDITDAYIEQARWNMDNGQQLLGVLSVLTKELVNFIRDMDNNVRGDLVTQLEEFISTFTKSAFNLKDYIEAFKAR